jgi:drug/metabolite transporter (DMT)-like permease
MTVELPAAAAIVVLCSALVHATWNVMLARAPRGHDVTAIAVTLGLLAWTPVALARWRVESGVWPYVLASASLELAYFAALNFAYARAPAHAAYPVARGLAPTLLLPIAVLGGAGVPAIAGLGVLAISAGVLLTARGETDRRSVLAAVPVAVCIAGYTYVDALGLRYADPAPYLWLTMAPVAVVLLVVRVLRGRGVDGLRAQLRPSVVGLGLGIYLAYGLTLLALSLVSVALVPAVAALRETSILFVLGLSWLTGRRSTVDELGAPTRTRPTATTAAGAVFILGGVALLALG